MEPLNTPANLATHALRNAAVEAAWEQAIQHFPMLTLLGATGGSLKQAMLEAVDNAIAAGVVDPQELVLAATVRIPRLRSPNGQAQQSR